MTGGRLSGPDVAPVGLYVHYSGRIAHDRFQPCSSDERLLVFEVACAIWRRGHPIPAADTT